MKYTCEIVIEKPRAEVVNKMDNPDNMKHWQRGLVSYDLVGDIPAGQQGAKMDLKYQMGKRTLEMTETITRNDLPDVINMTYDAKGVHNIQNNKFVELSEGQTKWISESEFQFSGFMKVLMFFMGKKAFVKQSMQYMQDFKRWVEEDVSVAQ